MAEVLISENAAERLKETIAERREDSAGLRVYVEHRCHCGGLKYGMALAEARDGDEQVVISGLQVSVAADLAAQPGSAEIDYVESPLGRGFTLTNSEHTCGGPMAH